MHIKWRDQLDRDPRLREIRNWHSIDPTSLPVNRRKGYLRNRKIVANILAGHKIKNIAYQCSISEAYISKLMQRCLASPSDGIPALTNGLIPYRRITAHQRRCPLDTLSEPCGHQNAFRALLDIVPGMKERLDEFIIERLKDKNNAQVLSPRAIFGEFKYLLKIANWPTDQYPYTTDSMAYESVRLYYHKRLIELKNQRRRPRVESSKPLDIIYRPFKSIQIDAQIVDLNTTVNIQFNQEIRPTRIRRVVLYMIRDTASQGILAYHIAYANEANQDDVLELFDNFRRPWEPIDIQTPGLQYTPSSGFPSMWGEDFACITCDEVKMDNALVHLAASVRYVICNLMGATLNLGRPATPLARNFIEAAFCLINRTTHRFVSTTGSHPNDSIKETAKNSKSPPAVTLETFEEALSIQIADYNAIPRAELNNETPLGYIRRVCAQHYIRWLPNDYESQWKPFEAEETCSVKNLANEDRRPFINFAYVRYRGECLSALTAETKKILIRYDRRDVRYVKAYTPNGEYLGSLKTPKTWLRFAHSLSTRKKIFKEMKTWKRHHDDPFAEYFHRLATESHIPKNALALVRIYKEAHHFTPEIATDSFYNSSDQQHDVIDQTIDIPKVITRKRKPTNRKFKSWHSSQAHHHKASEG